MATMKIAVTPSFSVGGSLFTPEQLTLLGSIVGKDAKIEFTTFKQLYVEIEVEMLELVKARLIETGLEIYPAGFYTKNLITCNFCRGAEEAGLEIAKALNEAIAGLEAPHPLKIGYAGCANATSEPLFKDIGVVKMLNGFNIYVGGEGKSIKAAVGELFLENLPESLLIPTIHNIIRYFQEHGKKKEKFSRFIQRVSIEKLRENAS